MAYYPLSCRLDVFVLWHNLWLSPAWLFASSEMFQPQEAGQLSQEMAEIPCTTKWKV